MINSELVLTVTFTLIAFFLTRQFQGKAGIIVFIVSFLYLSIYQIHRMIVGNSIFTFPLL